MDVCTASASARTSKQKPLPDAVTEYLAARKQDHERTLLSFRQLRSIANEMDALKRDFRGEIKKLQAESVRLDTGVIHIEPEVSKVRMKRRVTIQPNLMAWLRAYPLKRLPIHPAEFDEHAASRLQ